MPLSVIDYLALGGALNVAVFYDLLFLIVLFAACERDLEFDEPTFEVHLDGDYGKAFFGGFTCETFQLCFVKQLEGRRKSFNEGAFGRSRQHGLVCIYG